MAARHAQTRAVSPWKKGWLGGRCPGVPKVSRTKPDDRALYSFIHNTGISRYSGSFCVDYVWIFKASLRGGPPVIPTWREGRSRSEGADSPEVPGRGWRWAVAPRCPPEPLARRVKTDPVPSASAADGTPTPGRPPHVGDTWKVAGVASWWVRTNPAAASRPHSPPPSFVHQQESRGLPGTHRGHGGRATHHLGERASTGRCTALTKRGRLALVAAEVSKRGSCNRPQPWI